jgi:hypothetical protein
LNTNGKGGNLPRAKSMQQQGRPAEKPSVGRPHSTRSAGVSKAEQQKKENEVVGKPKPAARVAFGQPIKENMSRLAAKGKNVLQPVPKASGKDNKKDIRPGANSDNGGGRNNNNPSNRAADGGDKKGKLGFGRNKGAYSDQSISDAVSGFGLLKARAQAGPVVVSYDDESSAAGGGGFADRASPRRRAHDRSSHGSSFELSGESEYLKVGKSDADIIGGDQLDRLLVQARRARVAN